MSIRKLNTKTKLPPSYTRARGWKKKKLTKFVSELRHKREGRRGQRENTAMNNVFVVQFLRVYFWVN